MFLVGAIYRGLAVYLLGQRMQFRRDAFFLILDECGIALAAAGSSLNHLIDSTGDD